MEEHSVEALRAGLRRGDQDAFRILVDRCHPGVVRLAGLYREPSAPGTGLMVARAWRAVLAGLDDRVRLRGWVGALVVGHASDEAGRGPFAAAAAAEADGASGTVAAERFAEAGPWAGHWEDPPPRRFPAPDPPTLAAVVSGALAALPPGQRAVVGLRDVEAWCAGDVGSALGIPDDLQCRLLHLARSRLRRALELHHDRM